VSELPTAAVLRIVTCHLAELPMNDLLAIALSNAAWSIPLALVALVVTWRCRQPAVVHAMWLIVLLKLVSPPLVRLPLPELLASEPAPSDCELPPIAAHKPVQIGDGDLAPVPGSEIAPDCGRRILSPPDPPRELDIADRADEAESSLPTVPPLAPFQLAEEKSSPEIAGESRRDGETPSAVQSANGFPSRETSSKEARAVSGKLADAAVERSPAAIAELPSHAPRPSNASPEMGVTAQAPPAHFASESSVAVQSVAESDATPLVSPAALQAAATCLVAIWAAGSCGWFVLAAIRISRFAGTVRRASPADARFAARVAELSLRIGLRRGPQVRIVSSRVSPLVWPALRPVLILPAHLVARLQEAELDAVIGHELAHLRRRDHWTRWLELAAVGLYWWLPVVWLAKRRLHAAEEACCDAWVLWLLPKHARQYARALLTTIDFLTPPRPAPLLASGFGGATSLHGRFEMILHQKPPRAMTAPVKFTVAAFGLLALPLSVIAQSAPGGVPTAEAAPKAGNVAANDPAAPGGVPSATPPTASNGGPRSALPATTPPTAQNSDLPPTGAPSTTPPAAAPAPAPMPPTAAPEADAADPFGPAVETAPRAGASASNRAVRPVPLATPGGLTPPAAEPAGRPRRVPVSPSPAQHAVHPGGDDINARLDRLEAMVASLASEIHAMHHAEVDGGTRAGYAGGMVTRAPAGVPKLATPTAFNTVSEVGVRTNNKNILLRLGERIEAVDHESGKVLWTTALPGGDQARSWQVTNNMLQVEGADGVSVVVDLNNGSIVGISMPAARLAPNPKPIPAVNNDKAAKLSAEINEIEQAQLQLQNELDRMQIEEDHNLGKYERLLERAKRDLDRVDKTPEDKLSGDERKKAEAEALGRLEKIEDEGLDASYQFQSKRSALQQRLREFEVRRAKLARDSNEPQVVAPRR
jgi:beta-lactamase regulating signal transducer with metallopeptidase domain